MTTKTNPIAALLLSAFLLASRGFGQGPFFAPRYETQTGGYEASGDFDGDGDIDLFGTAPGQPSRITVFLNDGAGNFTAGPFVYAPAGQRSNIVTGDFNNDGQLDVVIGIDNATVVGPSLVMYTRNPSGGFAIPWIFQTPATPVWLETGDANGDGIEDILAALNVVVSIFSSTDNLQWWIGGSAGLTSWAPVVAFYGIPNRIAILDADSDGDDDVAYLEFASPPGEIIRFLMSNSGVMSPGLTYSLTAGGGAWSQIAAGDFDGDGKDDLGFYNHGGGENLQIARQTTNGNFVLAAPQSISSIIQPQLYGTLKSADLDCDGRVDLFYRSENVSGQVAITSNSFFLNSNGLGAFEVALTMPVGVGESDCIIFDDFNGDSIVDVAVCQELLFLKCEILRNTTLQLDPSYTVFDLDRDGDLDYVTVSNQVGLFNAALNNGRGAFTPPFSLGATLPSLVTNDIFPVNDVNGDGLLDVISLVSTAPVPGGTLYRGLPQGTFQIVGPTLSNPSTPLDLTRAIATDFDQDGFIDIALESFLLRGSASLSFTAVAPPWAGYFLRRVGDINGDGRPDALAVQPSSSTMRLVLSTSFGIFTGVNRVINGMDFETLTLADFDDDGDLDVGVQSLTSNFDYWIHPTQNGVFQAPVMVTVSPLLSNSVRFASGDFNLDGKTDIATIENHIQRNLATIFLRTGPGLTYAARFQQVLTPTAQYVDVDNDGDLDAFGPRITHNTTRHGASGGYAFQYGSGNPGSNGSIPILGTSGAPRSGSTVTLRGRLGLGGAPSLISIGTSASNLPNVPVQAVTTLNGPWIGFLTGFTNSGSAALPASGSVDIPILIPPSLVGLGFNLQWAIGDPAAPGQMTASNGVRIVIGG